MALGKVTGLELKTCPHCGIDNPNMMSTGSNTRASDRTWSTFACSKCDGIVLACTRQLFEQIAGLSQHHNEHAIDAAFPPRAKAFYEQAVHSLNAPAGAVMLAASTVAAMLKEVGYSEGSLFSRIEKAADDKVISEDMVQWASWVGLDKDEDDDEDDDDLPTADDANRILDFVRMMGEWLFVFPERVKQGIKIASESADDGSGLGDGDSLGTGRTSLLNDGMD